MTGGFPPCHLIRGLPHDQCRWENSRVVFLPVPYDLTQHLPAGSRRGPLAILEASTHLELFDEVLEQETYRWVSYPGLPGGGGYRSQEMIARVNSMSKAVPGGQISCPPRGEHSLALGSGPGPEKEISRVSFLQLDAHADLRESYEGLLSAMPVRPAPWRDGTPVQVGIRSLTRMNISTSEKER